MADVLENILDARKVSLEQRKKAMPMIELERRLKETAAPLSFSSAINKKGVVTLIAEMKKKSPSAGVIRDPYQVIEIAKAYEQGGASALSVLTEETFFGGSIDDLRQVSTSVSLPILRKDFIFDPYQVLEARVFGASAVLLIADMCDEKTLCDLATYAKEVGLDALVEIFSEESIERALKTQSGLFGVNTRNLRTLEMHPENIGRFYERIPENALLVAESGIKSAADVVFLKGHGAAAMLVGESLLKQSNLTQAVKTLVTAGQYES